jgi:hypothetical protein
MTESKPISVSQGSDSLRSRLEEDADLAEQVSRNPGDDFRASLFKRFAKSLRDASSALASPPVCSCGDTLTVCVDCAVADYQAEQTDCRTCCPTDDDRMARLGAGLERAGLGLSALASTPEPDARKIESWCDTALRLTGENEDLRFKLQAQAEEIARLTANQESRILQLTAAVRWALGEYGEFVDEPPPLKGKYRRRFWWRTELRERAFGPSHAAPEARRAAPPETGTKR